MRKVKISSIKVVHGESDSSYQMAIESALRSVKYKPGASHIANILIFGMGFENGKFRVTLQLIFTEPEGLEELSKQKPSPDKMASSKTRTNIEAKKKPKKEDRKPEKDDYRFDKEDDAYHPAYTHHAFIEFNNHSISHVLETSLDNTWEIHPESQVYEDIYEVIRPYINLPESQVRIYTEPVKDISVMVPTQTGFTRRFTGYMQALHDAKAATEIALKLQPYKKKANDLRSKNKKENYNE